uniref:Uncharacterized protein n=1 Tax=Homalodisca liturata TaxID=320908 RepID=A0A1B6IWT5_9HEMI
MSKAVRNASSCNEMKHHLALRKKESEAKLFQTKIKYYDNVISNSHNVCKTIWRVINNKAANKEKFLEYFDANFDLDMGEACDSYELCETFNNFYCDIVEEQIITNLTHSCGVSVLM